MNSNATDIPELYAALSPEARAAADARARACLAAELAGPRPRPRAPAALREALRRMSRALVKRQRVADLLADLLGVGRLVGVRRIRYYRYDDHTDRLLSIDCAGHAPGEAMRIRLGNIVKVRRECSPNSSDSYLSIDRRSAVLFDIDPGSDAQMADRGTVGGLPIVVLARGQCEQVLDDSPYRFRVDYALTQAGVVVGKFSCDLDVPGLSAQVARRLRWFGRVALRASAPITVLHAAKVKALAPVCDAARDDVARAAGVRQLFDYCVDELPGRFNIRHASLFTLSTDATGSTRLILRRTSYLGSRHLEDGASGSNGQVGYYQLAPDPDKSITSWVARAGRPIRLQHLNQPDMLRRQLAVLDPSITWTNKVQDSDSHTSFLAVPIVVAGKTLGVLRLTEKAAGDAQAYFTDMDEKCLTRIAADYIGPRLAELQIRESQQRFCDAACGQSVVARALAETFQPSSSAESARHRQVNFHLAMRHVFKEQKRSRHLYLVNHVPANSRRFTHLTAAGSLAYRIQDRMKCSYDLEGTLTGRALEYRSWVYLHDIPRAAEQSFILPLLPETASVLACPIALGSKGRGAIVLHSDRHDILPEVHGPLLHYLTSLTTGILTCRCQAEGDRD